MPTIIPHGDFEQERAIGEAVTLLRLFDADEIREFSAYARALLQRRQLASVAQQVDSPAVRRPPLLQPKSGQRRSLSGRAEAPSMTIAPRR